VMHHALDLQESANKMKVSFYCLLFDWFLYYLCDWSFRTVIYLVNQISSWLLVFINIRDKYFPIHCNFKHWNLVNVVYGGMWHINTSLWLMLPPWWASVHKFPMAVVKNSIMPFRQGGTMAAVKQCWIQHCLYRVTEVALS
jgi:hypothetical protein